MKKNVKNSNSDVKFVGEVKLCNSGPCFPEYKFTEIVDRLRSFNVSNPDLPEFPIYKLITVDSDSDIIVTFSNDLAYLINTYKVTCDFVGIYVRRTENSMYQTLKLF